MLDIYSDSCYAIGIQSEPDLRKVMIDSWFVL
jgi:hypothetical protein